MSSKITIRKFETGIYFKSLQMMIEDEDNDLCIAQYGEWLDGKPQQKEKATEKSLSRLIIKIVSEDDVSNMDLDSCAQEVGNQLLKVFNDTRSNGEDANPRNEMINEMMRNDGKLLGPINNVNIKSNMNQRTDIYSSCEGQYEIRVKTPSLLFNKDQTKAINHNEVIESDNIDGDKSPLEYSLEKVKENNARIMENIHMLNRTLTYTKKREILDIVCPKPLRSYPCNSCGKCFVYETGLKRHYSMRHSMTEIQPRWQIVWTCIECFQVWPRQDLALRHSSQCCKSDSVDCVREIKTSSLLQCEFCEKVFTSIPRLLRHSKMHTTINNYECNACEATFFYYKTAEEHWLLCPWLKMCYTFSLPKLLLCNACDRKFRNYDQLYNHRYKIGHFTAKSEGHSNSDSIVYQCEICGQCLSSIPSLQIHKAQCHPQCGTGMQYCNIVCIQLHL
ncbi:zinc finger protein 181-like [Achroia grisella]|uniref:zinc finger protein 181-like n=1 Tax=Achroia grisella TaxID=688607 RepID=UPI0027D2CD43|nr:zinc finger protein 181-like [Achroia grisella]